MTDIRDVSRADVCGIYLTTQQTVSKGQKSLRKDIRMNCFWRYIDGVSLPSEFRSKCHLDLVSFTVIRSEMGRVL